VIYLLAVADNDLFLLFYRDKNDPLGANASMKNPVFLIQLHRYLDLLEQDIQSGALDSIPLA